MAIAFGPKLGLINNANIGETYYDQFRQFLQALDQLVMGSILDTTLVIPPTTPNNGDSYLLITATPTGAWAGQMGNIAVWDTQVTTAGTNTQVPAWVFYVPQPGWIVWNVATASLIVFNGSAWVGIGGGANFPVNTNITSMVGIPNTTIDTTGYDLSVAGTGEAKITVQPGGPGGQIFLNDGIVSSLLTSQGLSTGGLVVGNILASGTVAINTLAANIPGVGIVVTMASPGVGTATLVISGSGVIYQGLIGFSNYATQTTVGAAGGASALPATPTGYLPVNINGTIFIMPYYAHV